MCSDDSVTSQSQVTRQLIQLPALLQLDQDLVSLMQFEISDERRASAREKTLQTFTKTRKNMTTTMSISHSGMSKYLKYLIEILSIDTTKFCPSTRDLMSVFELEVKLREELAANEEFHTEFVPVVVVFGDCGVFGWHSFVQRFREMKREVSTKKRRRKPFGAVKDKSRQQRRDGMT